LQFSLESGRESNQTAAVCINCDALAVYILQVALNGINLPLEINKLLAVNADLCLPGLQVCELGLQCLN